MEHDRTGVEGNRKEQQKNRKEKNRIE